MCRQRYGILSALLWASAGCSGAVLVPDGGAPIELSDDSKPGAATRLFRLSHEQWANSIDDLFGFDESVTDWTANFPVDPNPQGYLYGNHSTALVVDYGLQQSYESATESIAKFATADDFAALGTDLPSSGSDEERVRSWIQAFGRKAHRRPLSAEEVDAYVEVFRVGADNAVDITPFESGIQLAVRALLLSPHFIYRLERSTESVNGVIPLDNYEVAARLSYFLTNSTPDSQLLAAAAAGVLTRTDGVLEQAERLMETERGVRTFRQFHEILLAEYLYDTITPAEGGVLDAPSNLAELARIELTAVLDDAHRADKGWRALLTTTETWVNDELAAIYGLEGSFGASFEKVSLNPDERRGIFTLAGFLASRASDANPSIIRRGAYLTQEIACNSLGLPEGIEPIDPDAEGTNRERVAAVTESGTCASCHTSLINPFGYILEGFDAVGRVRTEDAGQPVNTVTELLIQNEIFPVSRGTDLGDVLANSAAVHECYAKHWVELAFGRRAVSSDTGLIRALGAASLEGDSIRSLILSIVTNPAFLNRNIEELQ